MRASHTLEAAPELGRPEKAGQKPTWTLGAGCGLVVRCVGLPKSALRRNLRLVCVDPAGRVHQVRRNGTSVWNVELGAYVCLERGSASEIVLDELLGLLPPLV